MTGRPGVVYFVEGASAPLNSPWDFGQGDAIDTISQVQESLRLVLIKSLAKPPRQRAV